MTVAVRRGCGKRTQGGVYLTTEFSAHGIPIQYFLYDPPWIPLDDEGEPWYPNSLGVALTQREDGFCDVWDWIGSDAYPYFPDFWEEGVRFEFSRKVSPHIPFEMLKLGKSEQIGVHPKGLPKLNKTQLDYTYDYEADTSMNSCPHHKEIHEDGEANEFCTRLLWQFVGHGPYPNYTREFPVDDPVFSYLCAPLPDTLVEWYPAALYHLPIHKIEVINDPVEGLHEDRVEILIGSGTDIPFEVVEE